MALIIFAAYSVLCVSLWNDLHTWEHYEEALCFSGATGEGKSERERERGDSLVRCALMSVGTACARHKLHYQLSAILF